MTRSKKIKPEDAPKSWRERAAALRNLPPLLRLVWQTSPRLCFCALAFRLVIAFVPIANIWVSRSILNLVVRAIRHQGVDDAHLWRLVAIDVALTVIADVFSRLIVLADSLLGDQFTNDMSVKVMQHAMTLDLESFEDPAFCDTMERARKQAASRLGMVVSVAGIARQLLTLLTMVSVVIFVSPWLLPMLAIAMIPQFLGETKSAVLNYSLLYRQTAARRELDYLRYLGASGHSAKEVKVFGLGHYLIDRVTALFGRFHAENRRLSIRRAIQGTALNLISTTAYYATYVFILVKALTGAITVGDLTMLIRAFSRAHDIMESLLSQLAEVTEQAVYTRDLFDYFDMKPKIASGSAARPPPRPIRTGYEFRNVSFAYPGADRPILNQINFRLGRGERIALVGDNGAGKTTLVKLLARLYDPTEGCILLDGVDLREYQVDDLRREIGVIFQDYLRYDMLAGENIGLGRVEDLADRAKIEASAEKSRAARLIAKLPKHYEQMLGRRFEGGVELSTGQWQKIALARAYMRDAQVLVLDEPTASLDARAEFEVYQRFLDLARDKIAVLISHRFSTVRVADRILVLEKGAILEEGSHERLVSIHGKYAELFELQAAGYR